MARRHLERNEKLNLQQLTELRNRLAAMPRSELDIFYKSTHNACSYAVRIPPPAMIQDLVQAWKELR